MEWDEQEEGKEIPASVIMKVQNGTTLMEMVNKAAEDDKNGPYNKYDSIYHGGMGYVITGMYGIEEDPATDKRWMILEEHSGKTIPCGVDFYVPENGSSIVFRFTTYSADSDHNHTTSGYCKPASSSHQVRQSLQKGQNTSEIIIAVGRSALLLLIGRQAQQKRTNECVRFHGTEFITIIIIKKNYNIIIHEMNNICG